jgi:hypothetical protein
MVGCVHASHLSVIRGYIDDEHTGGGGDAIWMRGSHIRCTDCECVFAERQ